MLGRLDKNSFITHADRDSDSEFQFWGLFFAMLGQRESGINNSLDSQVILSVLKRLARTCREKNMPNGPITVENISESFKSVTNMAPDASSLQMLQRLPCLGRFESGSENRVFVDEYVLDGIRGEDVADIITSGQLDIDDRGWKHPINSFGAGVASHNIEKLQSKNLTLQYLRSRSKLNDSGILNGCLLYTSPSPRD